MKRHLITTGIFLLAIGGVVYWFSREVNLLLTSLEPKTSLSKSVGTIAGQDAFKPNALTPLLPAPDLSEEAKKIMQQIFMRFNAGDYNAALQIAETTLENPHLESELHAWIRQQLPALLVSVGWLEIKLGRCDNALTTLRRATAMAKSVEAAKGMAFCAYKLRDYMTADEQFVYYLQNNSKDTAMSLLYADLLESDFRFQDAARILEVAKLADADNEMLAKRLAAMHARAKESKNQLTLNSDVFKLTYRSPDHDDLVDKVLEVLVQAKDEFIERFNFSAPKESIEVILYSHKSFKDVVSGGPEWAEGIFDGRMRIPIAEPFVARRDFPTLKRVLRHELVHAMLALMLDFRSLPPWFEEGIAQRLECDFDCKRNIFGLKPGKFLHRDAFFQPYTAYNQLKADQSYRQSLYLIYVLERDDHFMGDENLAQLINHIKSLKDLTSDSIVAFLKTDFDGVYSRASELWAAGQTF